ncbi:MAG: hypothetical protein ACI9VR_005062 [Cognaticolwellia sp.]|jgi:hypothetical protein
MTETATETESSVSSKQEQGPPDHLSKKEMRQSGVGKPKFGQQNKEPLPNRGEDGTRPYAEFDALIAQYEQWLNYDPAQNAEEADTAQRINTIFDPVNESRNQQTEDMYEGIQASGAQLAQDNANAWGAMEGRSGAAITNNAKARLADSIEFREKGTAWDPNADTGVSGGLKGDLTQSGFSGGSKGFVNSHFDDSAVQSKLWNTKKPEDVAAIGNAPVKGYSTFKDEAQQTVSVPQLGWGKKKPVISKWTMEEKETWCPHVEGSAAKQRSGSKGQNVWNNAGGGFAAALGSVVNGGKHMMGKEGSGEVTGWDQYIQHYRVRPDGSRTPETRPKSAINERRVQLNKLKAYYEERRKFIDDYSSYLPD